MVRKNDFYTVEFFRKVRDEQAAMLQGKTNEEIIAFFASFCKGKKAQSINLNRQKAAQSGKLG